MKNYFAIYIENWPEQNVRIIVIKDWISVFVNILFSALMIVGCLSCTKMSAPQNNMESALLKDDWQTVFDECKKEDSLFTKPETAALMGHAALMLNKNNASYILFNYINIDSTRRYEWQTWADDFQKQFPKQAIAYYFQGDAYMRNHQQDKALECFNKAIQIDPECTLALNARGIYYAIYNINNEALNDLNNACKLNPKIADFFSSRATIKYNNKAPEGAFDDYSYALKYSPNFALALNGKACSILFDTRKNELKENILDTISLYNANNQLGLPFIKENIRNMTLHIENKIFPDFIESPLFRSSDFLDWKKLQKKTKNDQNDLLKLLLKKPLPEELDYIIMNQLNELLTKEHLFKNLLESKNSNDSLSRIILKEYDNSLLNRDSIVTKNRKIFEVAYKGLIASFKNRNPGTTIKSSSSTFNNKLYDLGEEIYKAGSSGEESDKHVTTLAGLVATGMTGNPAIGAAAKMGTDLSFAAGRGVTKVVGLSASIAASNMELKKLKQQRDNLKANYSGSYNKAVTEGRIKSDDYYNNSKKPGGAIADIKREYKDKDIPYFLICFNGLIYEKE